MSTIEAINKALTTVIDPELHKPLPELGMVESVSFESGVATIKILLTISGCPMKDRLKLDITNSLKNINEIKSLDIIFGVMNDDQRNAVKKNYPRWPGKIYTIRSTRFVNKSFRHRIRQGRCRKVISHC